MGISLVIRSSIHNCGKSVLSFLLVCKLSQVLRKDMSILVCCACMQHGGVIDMAGNAGGYPTLEDLVNAGISSENNDADIKSLLYKSGEIYFIDSSKATPLFVKNNSAGYIGLMEFLKQQFDIIITDTSSAPENPLTQLTLENCDHILDVAVQDIQMLQKSIQGNQKNLAYVINRYDNIYPDKNELSKLLKIKNIFTLPNCIQLQEMKNRNHLYQYAELHTDYMRAVGKLADFLAKEQNLPKEERKSNRSFIQFLRKGDT